MPSLCIWWLPEACWPGLLYPFIARSPAGRLWRLANHPRAWQAKHVVKWDRMPTSEPLPERIGLIIGGLVGLPGCAVPTPRELAEVGEFLAAERQEFERGDVAPYRKGQRKQESFIEVSA